MSKIYASFSDPSLAEKAAGALLDYGVHTDDISLVRGGNEEEHRNWEASRASNTYGQVGTMGSEPTAAETSASGPIGGQFIDRSDPSYIYQNEPSDAELNDPHYRAAERASNSDYTENRVEMEKSDESHEDLSAKKGLSTTTPADAGAGAGKGAGIGLGVGILAGLASLFLPGVGIVLGGGALIAALGGAVGTTAAGAVAGAVTGYLKDQGVEEHVASQYQTTLDSGGALLEVNVPSGDVDEATAQEVLAKYGASNVGAYAGKGGYVS